MNVVFFHPPARDGWIERRGWTGSGVPALGDGVREREGEAHGWMKRRRWMNVDSCGSEQVEEGGVGWVTLLQRSSTKRWRPLY